MKTSELTGAALDWAVAKAIGEYRPVAVPAYSTDWTKGGPIIEREGISVARRGEHSFSPWGAVLQGFEFDEEGPTPLIAVMRCYVASKLGDDVTLPPELEQTA